MYLHNSLQRGHVEQPGHTPFQVKCTKIRAGHVTAVEEVKRGESIFLWSFLQSIFTYSKARGLEEGGPPGARKPMRIAEDLPGGGCALDPRVGFFGMKRGITPVTDPMAANLVFGNRQVLCSEQDGERFMLR